MFLSRRQERDNSQRDPSVRLLLLPRMENNRMPDLDRRRFFTAAAASLAASQLGLLALPGRLQAMTGSIPETVPDAGGQFGPSKAAVRPFHVSFPEEQLSDLRRRIKATKWPERETVAD